MTNDNPDSGHPAFPDRVWLRRAPPRLSNRSSHLKSDDVSVCRQYPGFDSDVIVNADQSAFYQMWLGRITFADAVRSRSIEIVGIPSLVRGFPRWFALSPVVELVRNRKLSEVTVFAHPNQSLAARRIT